MKKIAIIFGLTLLLFFLMDYSFSSCCNNCESEKPVIHQEKTVYNLCEISSYLGMYGELTGGIHGDFFLGIGSISGKINGKITDVPKAFCVLEQNGDAEIKSIPIDQLSIVYINDPTQQRVEAYRWYETSSIGTLYYDYSDVKTTNLNNYIKVNTFNNIANYDCYSVHIYYGNLDGLSYLRTSRTNVYPAIDPSTTIYYKFYILEKNIVHLSNMKNLSK